jgi:hypothetical protein
VPGQSIMTKNIQTIIFFTFLTALISCSSPTNKPIHFTDKFTFKDKDGNENSFYGFKNIDSARHWATIEKKRILVIFSCYACMDEGGKEWKTLTYFGDNNKIQNNFILYWVPVDDKTPVDDPDQTFLVNEKEVELKTVGERNWYWQTNLTKTSTQPTMCFIDTIGAKYGDNLNYSKDKNEIETFINVGLDSKTKGLTIFYPPIPKINFVESGDTL